jgi:transglutaminase-like putative cysteine protease
MSAWVALVLLDAVTVATFARCFTGPGELLVAIPVCVGAHIIAHLARQINSRGDRLVSVLVWAAAAVFVGFAPILLVDGGWSQVPAQLHGAWHVFSYNIAPVVQAPGLELACAWAAGILGLAAEALDADTSLPAIVALVPAFDIVMFTGTLGTPVGRAPELAALAALSVWYLTGTKRRATQEQVVTARLEGTSRLTAGPVAATSSWFGKLTSQLGSQAPGLVAVAAFAAGVVGPLAPGAQTAAVVNWHGSGHGAAANAGGHNGGGNVGPISLSDTVELQEVEVDDANIPVLAVSSPAATREVLFVLDGFNGDSFLPVVTGPKTGVAIESPDLMNNALPPVQPHDNSAEITQVITDIDLTGNQLPIAGHPVNWVAGDFSQVLQEGTDGTIFSKTPISPKQRFEVQSYWAPSPAVAQQYLSTSAPQAPAIDTELPKGIAIPQKIVTLAHEIIGGQTTLVGKADAIQDFLLSRYTYFLPTSTVVTSSKPYAALSNFLFVSHKGYCQQFAAAFAVLARIDNIPTRIAVGFLPGAREKGSNTYLVTGSEYHAWPQVYFPGSGWIDFEPTPQAGNPPAAPVVTTTTTTTSTTPTTTLPNQGSVPGSSVRCRSCLPPGNTGVNTTTTTYPLGVPPPGGAGGSTGRGSGSRGGSSGVGYVLLAMAVLACLWALVVTGLREMRWLRRREPASGMVLAWHDVVVALAAAGLHRRRSETLAEFARRVQLAGLLTDEASQALGRVVQATNSTYFSLSRPTPDNVDAARTDARIICRSARRSISWWLRVLMSLDPRDLIGQGA